MSNPAETLLKVYGGASVSRIADLSDPEAAVEALTLRFKDKTARKKVLKSLPDESVGFLAFMDKIGRRLRGERLKKRWFLHGYEDFERRIEPLVNSGVVLVGNAQAREPVSLETALDQGLLQQWIQVTPGFDGLSGDQPPAREVVSQVSDETRVEVARRTLVVEFNLLNCVNYVEREGIRLNRDGSPHRSDLKGLAPLLIDRPGSSGSGDSAPDPLSVDGWDLISFLLSLSESLGMIERDGDVLKSIDRSHGYFMKPLEERLPVLTRAVEHQRAWSELDAAAWLASGEPPVTGEGDGGFLHEESHGVPLAGPRGSVFAAIRRLNPTDWFDVEETATTITALELQYLKSALPVPAGDETSPGIFVRSVITNALVHIGGVELGRGSNKQIRARLTPIGRNMLGMGEPPEEPNGKGSILVEPNFEITSFLDMINLHLLYDLSRFAELSRTSERVARYRLHGESAQFGYARGYAADGIVELLSEYSAQPLPPSVTFALQDWERLHRRVSVFVRGDMVAASGRSEPEVIQSGVAFAVHNDDEVERIDAVHTFVAGGYRDELARALHAAKPTIIDYEGEIVATLSWIDEERVSAPNGATDLRSLARLQQIAVLDGDATYRIAPDKVRSNFDGDQGFLEVISTLRDGLIEGLSPEREIALKSLLGEPAGSRVESMQVLMVSSDDDGDRIARIQSVSIFIEERLGPRAFKVEKGKAKKLAEALRKLGIAVEVA
ncbi:MAG: hypothetical protein ACJAYU_001809 [Bradymonadia bacterium]